MSDAEKQATELRRQAEKRLRKRYRDPLTLTADQLPGLIHELEVHQIELELQNEELQRSSLELKAARDSYAELFDLAPVGYLILDPTGRMLRINLTGAEMLGMHRTQSHGSDFFRFVAEEHRDTLYRHLRQVFNDPTRQDCELELMLADGARFFVKLYSVAQADGDEGNPHCLSLVSDITGLKKAEVISRQARKAAEDANQAKSHFLAAASHDLRQPLQAMTTIKDVLRRRLVDEEALGFVDMLAESLEHMSGLFNTLLNVSQLESGSITPEMSEFPVNELLHRIDTLYRPLAEQKGLRLHVAQSSATIRSDPVLLGQILDNLVSNAIRYTETGKVLLGCRRHGAMLRIEVWDTGMGVPEDMHRLIFEDYYQLDNPARDRTKGLGLGLAIAARSAHLLGRRIELRSREQGSLFSVEAPLAALERSHEQTPAGNAANDSVAPAIFLLVVDDNHSVLYSLIHLLQSYGYTVTGAMNGQEALATIQSGTTRFDFIISDYRLPEGETGVELIKAVRQAIGAEIPALIITGDLEVAMIQEVVASGLRVLEKPVYAEALNKAIQEILTLPGQ